MILVCKNRNLEPKPGRHLYSTLIYLSALDLPPGNNKTHVKYEFMPLVCNISPNVHCCRLICILFLDINASHLIYLIFNLC